MDFELRRAREKLEREQKDRKERAKLRLEREKKAKQEAIRQREAIEAAQRARRIDAAEAEAKANQQMQESLIAGRGIVFCRVLEAVPYQGSGDKIKLPPSCFTELSEQGAFDKGPLHFSLTVIHQSSSSNTNDEGLTNRKTHAGVLEFTAEEGFAGLPPHIWSNLFSVDNPTSPTVEVQYVWLAKGTYAKLQPVEPGFSDIPNHKAVLETSLRQHATLSEGDVLTVSHGVLTYHLRVLELKPSSSVSVLETDIEVDVISADPAAEGTSQHILRPLTFGKPEVGVVEESNYIYYKFSIDDGTWLRISSGDAEIEVKVESTAQDGDTDLYISRHPLLFPTQHQHGWSSHDVGSKALVLGSRDQGLGADTYSIGVYGFKGTTRYQVTVTVQDKLKPKLGLQTSVSTSETDTVECRNCKHNIPSRSIALHEAYCSRHNIVCQHASCGIVLRREEAEKHVHCVKCGQAFQKEEIEKHMKVFHEPLNCPCGVVLEKEKMVQHQSSECHLRLITCRFCGDMVQAGNSAADVRDRLRGLTEHESLCGSRTAPCDSCGRSVMLKDMDIHHIAVHQNN
nr:TRAF-like protein [Ipomoea batatas]